MYLVEVIFDLKVEFSQNSLDLVLSKLRSSHEKLKNIILYGSYNIGTWPQDQAGVRGRPRSLVGTRKSGA